MQAGTKIKLTSSDMRPLLFIFFLLCACALQAQNHLVYHLDSNRQVHDLKQYTYVLTNPYGKMPKGAALSGRMDSQFVHFNEARSREKGDEY